MPEDNMKASSCPPLSSLQTYPDLYSSSPSGPITKLSPRSPRRATDITTSGFSGKVVPFTDEPAADPRVRGVNSQ